MAIQNTIRQNSISLEIFERKELQKAMQAKAATRVHTMP